MSSALFVVSVFCVLCHASSNKYCKTDPEYPNHLFSLWKSDFPGSCDDEVPATCEGTLSSETEDEVCVDGRVTYGQLEDLLSSDDPIFQPAVKSISINGHMTAATGNLVLGSQVRYMYSMITSYTIGGVTYQSSPAGSGNSEMADNLLAASRGTVDAFSLNRTLLQPGPASWFEISHDFFVFLDRVDMDSLRRDDVGLLFFSPYNSVVEYHTPVSDDPFFVTAFLSKAILSAVNFGVGFFPSFLYGILPVFAVTGTSRLIVKGTFSTADFPNPFTAPETLGRVEAVQVDAAWETLLSAIEEEGLFTSDDKKVPSPYINVVIKKLDDTPACSTATKMCGIDLEAPAGWGDMLDDYINDVVYPALAKHGDVTIHFGKRVPPNSALVQSALDFYGDCGVEVGLNITKEECHHPYCERRTAPTLFTYPSKYYDYDYKK